MIPKFTVVTVSGVDSDKPTVVRWAPAASEHPENLTAPKILGVTMTDSEYLEPVAVMRRGYLRDVAETSGETWVTGDLLWAASDGSVTNVRPAAPLPQVFVGTVFDGSGATFTVDVNVTALPNIGELSGVDRQTPVDRDILVYRADTSLWEPRQLWKSRDVSANATVDQHDYLVRADASGGDVTVTLPPAADSEGMVVNVKKVDSSANVVTIDGDGTELLDDAETFDLVLQGENLMMQCDGSSWAVI